MVQRHISRRKRVALGIVRGLLVVAFLAAGIAKLAGVPFMVAVFDHVGLGQWFRYVTGSIEIVGAILILTPRFVGVGGALLACTMGGAIISHLVAVPGSPVPAIVLLVLSATVAFAYRDRTLGLFGSTANLKVA